MAERDDEGFLARWSRRKQAAREAEREPEPEQDAPPAPARAGHAPAQPHEPERPPALPDPATLDASSDFSVFLGRDVPIETHRQALRRLWRLDPLYNRIDGLDDYCEDYTDKAKVVKGMRTAYKVGRGMLEQIGEPAVSPDAPAPTERAPATAEGKLAPPPEAPSGGGGLPSPVEAASLQPASAELLASDGPKTAVGAPPDRPDARAVPRAGPRPVRGGAAQHDATVPRPLPKRG
jgi:hypothetical protein